MLLTDLVKNEDGCVSLDGDDGTLRYTVLELVPVVWIDSGVAGAPKVRVAPSAAMPDAELEEEGSEAAEKDCDRMRR